MHPSQKIKHTASITQNRFGVMSCCAPDLSLKDLCALSKRAGASYIETFEQKLINESLPAHEVKKILEQAELKLLLVVAANLDCENPDSYIAHLREQLFYWKACGLEQFVTLRTGRGANTESFHSLLQRAADEVRSAGFIPLSQNHVNGMVETAQELADCKAYGVELHFDTQQFFMAGADALDAWNMLSEDIVHVHIADRNTDKKPCAFGQGVIGIRSILQRMHASGYQGAITMEPELARSFDSEEHVAQAIHYCHETLKPFDACGLAAPGHSAYKLDDCAKITADWGELHWISNDSICKNCEQTVGYVTIKAGHKNPAHSHSNDHEIIIIKKGTCRHFCDQHEVRLNEGDVLHLVPGQVHYAINDGSEDCEMIVLYPTGSRSFKKHTVNH